MQSGEGRPGQEGKTIPSLLVMAHAGRRDVNMKVDHGTVSLQIFEG